MNTNTTQRTAAQRPWRGIFFRGPEPLERPNGTEVPAWNVYLGDDQGRPKGRVYEVTKYERADKLAQCMAHDRCLEIINEAEVASEASCSQHAFA